MNGCIVEGCNRRHRARGYCSTHYNHIVMGRSPRHFDSEGRMEDICWMAETGESLAGVAKRLGVTQRAVEMFLTRYDRPDVLATLTRRNPRDPNNRTNLALLGDWG